MNFHNAVRTYITGMTYGKHQDIKLDCSLVPDVGISSKSFTVLTGIECHQEAPLQKPYSNKAIPPFHKPGQFKGL